MEKLFQPRSLAEREQRRDVSEAQAIAALLSLEVPNLTCTDLAFILNRDLSGLSQAICKRYPSFKNKQKAPTRIVGAKK